MRFLGVILHAKNALIVISWKGLNLVDSNSYVVEESVDVWLEIKTKLKEDTCLVVFLAAKSLIWTCDRV